MPSPYFFLLRLLCLAVFTGCFTAGSALAGNIAYIHGDISECGTTPSSAEQQGDCDNTAFDQMLLDDAGPRGLSQFVELMNQQGHTIEQFYDMETTLNTAFFANLDVLVFSLHQKLWSASERAALLAWLNNGGGMFIYSDSASGGSFRRVEGRGQNPIGQNVTNNLLQDFDLQVTVDQANGIRAVQAGSNTSIAAISNLTLEGEGVSPVAVKPSDTVTEILIPFDCSNCSTPHLQGVSLPRIYAALVLRPVGDGHVSVMFDRQPMWNQGPGSDINKQDNRVILAELINFLALRPAAPLPQTPPVSEPDSDEPVIVSPIVDLILNSE